MRGLIRKHTHLEELLDLRDLSLKCLALAGHIVSSNEREGGCGTKRDAAGVEASAGAGMWGKWGTEWISIVI